MVFIEKLLKLSIPQASDVDEEVGVHEIYRRPGPSLGIDVLKGVAGRRVAPLDSEESWMTLIRMNLQG